MATTISCPHCRGPIQDDGSHAGTLVGCPHCQGQLWMPGASPQALPPAGSPVGAAYGYSAPASVKVPLLISAIGNLLLSTLWLSSCFLFFLAIPYLILCAFEFSLYAKADTIKPRDFLGSATKVAIAEIVLGVFNVYSLVCGIIILANASGLKRRYAAVP